MYFPKSSRDTGLRYGVLFALAVVAFLFQGFYSKYVVNFYRNPAARVRAPFQYTPQKVIRNVSEQGRNAGLADGDVLLALDGHAFDGDAVFQQLLSKARPGSRFEATVRDASGKLVQAKVPLEAFADSSYRLQDWIFGVVTLLLVPSIALILGFGVVLIRLFDRRAWLILVLMMSFSQVYYLQGWDGPLRSFAIGYRTFAAATFSLWLFLFGIYFPETAPWNRRHPWLKWVFITPVLVIAVLATLNDVLAQHHLALIASWQSTLKYLQKVQTILRLSSIVLFLGMLTASLRQPFSPDEIRRLKTLRRGAGISLAPMFALVTRALIWGGNPVGSVPAWIGFPCVLVLDLFPCTLVYVIVVRRAFDNRVLLRQSVKYALARRSLGVLRFVSLGSLMATVVYIVNEPPTASEMALKAVLGLAFVTVAFESANTDRLRQWLDRHLFGVAYD